MDFDIGPTEDGERADPQDRLLPR